jgi:oligoendopeptidase F
VYDVPFYYIEYGLAQLGAIAVWRNYRKDPKKGLDDYMHALSLGYTRPIPEVYAAAGVRFDFSEPYIRELIDFIVGEIERLDRNEF